jgi:hypothetical protein
MRNSLEMSHEAMLALGRVAVEAAGAVSPEDALWSITRTLPALLGDRSAALAPKLTSTAKKTSPWKPNSRS